VLQKLLPRVDQKEPEADREIGGLAVCCIREGDGRIVHKGSMKSPSSVNICTIPTALMGFTENL
jgi:hypothetical protein